MIISSLEILESENIQSNRRKVIIGYSWKSIINWRIKCKCGDELGWNGICKSLSVQCHLQWVCGFDLSFVHLLWWCQNEAVNVFQCLLNLQSVTRLVENYNCNECRFNCSLCRSRAKSNFLLNLEHSSSMMV